jgi:replicative DNA helicase
VTGLWPEEVERGLLSSIIGAACVDCDAGLRQVRKARARGLHPSDFGLASYGVIFEAMLRFEHDGLPIDPISLAAELDRGHVDPRAGSRLHILAREFAPFGVVERYADLIVQAAGRRESEERAS